MQSDTDMVSIDWGQQWKTQMVNHNIVKNGLDCSALWNSKENAIKYDQRVKKNNWKKTTDQNIRQMNISSNDNVLDIGSGPGSIAIPLSQMGCHVTAVEPAEGMMWCLQENIKKDKIKTISCVQKKWEDVDLILDLECPYDVVIASFSLGMPDIVTAIEKMKKASCRSVYLFWHKGIPFWEKHYIALWKKLHGKRYEPTPKTSCLLKVLDQMEIHPLVNLFSWEVEYRFSDGDEIVEFFRKNFQIQTDKQMQIVKDYFLTISHRKNGEMIIKGSSDYAMIWWKK